MRLANLLAMMPPGGRGGNVVLMTALLMVPLLGMIALATDFGRASVAKGRLDVAADSAALLAATAASNAWNAGDVNAVQEAIAAAQGRFRAQSAYQSDVTVDPATIVLTQVGGTFHATVSYTASMTTTFGRVLGMNSLPIGGQSNASLSQNALVDIQILMDVSSSMTLAATAADITKMQSLTTTFVNTKPKPAGMPGNAEGNCAFACHWSAINVDFYKLAVSNKVQLRITVLQSAVSAVIDTLVGLDANQRFQLGLYSFGQQFNTVYQLSHDLASAQASVANILPDVNDCSSNCPDTYFTAAMTQLTAVDRLLPQTGDTVPQRFLFVVGDGVYDQYSATKARQIGAFNPADCAALKAMGVNILVLHTPYTPIPSNGFYVANVQPISPQIVPNLVACASSPSYYFVASDATEIQAQLQNMLQLVIRTTSHLTN